MLSRAATNQNCGAGGWLADVGSGAQGTVGEDAANAVGSPSDPLDSSAARCPMGATLSLFLLDLAPKSDRLSEPLSGKRMRE
jgi:hypothetical protein